MSAFEITRDGAVDYPAIQRLGRWLASVQGVKSLTVLGHAGEGTFLERDEQIGHPLRVPAQRELVARQFGRAPEAGQRRGDDPTTLRGDLLDQRCDLEFGQPRANAAVDAAQLDLSFTHVTAPISGRVGQALVTEGNYVASGVTPLTTIVSIHPLHVYFDVDERTYLRSLATGRSNATPQGAQAAKVMVALLTDQTYSRPGRVDFIANTSDRGTGTVRIRAVVDNPDGHLTPGLFAKVKLETGAPQARVLISDQSIGTDQGSRYVLVVGKDDKTEYRLVELGPVVDGLRVIEKGLEPSERIVVKGLVRPGMQITPQSAAIDGSPIAVPQTLGAQP